MPQFVLYAKGERGVSSLEALLAAGIAPVLCVSENANAEVARLCTQSGVPLVVDANPRAAEHIRRVHAHAPDFLVGAGYSRILPSELFSSLPLGGINCHGGRLPQYRGASPIPWQIINGETSGAAYVLRITDGIDDGPILAGETYPIGPDDTARDVTDRVTAIFARIVPHVVRQYLDGQIPAGTPQPDDGACHWTRRTPEDGLIDWQANTAKQVVDLVRGLDDPYPGAFVRHRDRRIVVRRARVFPRAMRGIPGRFVGRSEEGALIVAADRAVEVLEYEEGGTRRGGRELPARYGDMFQERC